MPPSWCKLSLHPATKGNAQAPDTGDKAVSEQKVPPHCSKGRVKIQVPSVLWGGGGAKPVEGITGGPFGLKSHCLTQERIQAGREPSYLALPGRRREGLAPDTSWASGWKISWIRVKISKKGTVTDAAALRERWCWPLPIPLISPNGRCLPMFIWPLPFTSCFSAVLFFFPDGNTMFRDKTDTKKQCKICLREVQQAWEKHLISLRARQVRSSQCQGNYGVIWTEAMQGSHFQMNQVASRTLGPWFRWHPDRIDKCRPRLPEASYITEHRTLPHAP